MIYTSYGPNEDNTTTLAYSFYAENDREAIRIVEAGDITFCDVEEIEMPCDSITIQNENCDIIYKVMA